MGVMVVVGLGGQDVLFGCSASQSEQTDSIWISDSVKECKNPVADN